MYKKGHNHNHHILFPFYEQVAIKWYKRKNDEKILMIKVTKY